VRRLLVTLFALAAIAGAAPLFSGANFAVQTLNPQTASAAADFVAPAVGSSVIADTTSGTPFDGAGYVAQGGTYRVYANVTDGGNPSSGIGAVTADLTAVSDGGHAAVSLVAGSYTVGGVTYNFASAEQTASTPLSEGSKSYTVSATDNASNTSPAASFNVTIDNTAPTIASSTIARADGVAPGYVRQGDSYYVYANASDPVSGIHDVTANVNAVTTGATPGLTTAGGPWTVDGTTYAYRSPALTANAALSDGSKAYTITAHDNATNTAGPTNFSVTADSTAPSIAGSAIATTAGGNPIDGPGVVRAGGTYRVYAEVSDAGVGIASVKANVSSVTGAQTAATLSFDSTGVSVGGTTYHWISSELTADSGLTAGTKSYSVTAADTLTNSGSQSFTVVADNTGPAVSLTSPTSNTTVNGTITPAATATDTNGVAFVTIQRSPAGANTWTDICTDSTSPYSCSFDTTTVSDGLYDFRAVATDKGGNTTNSAAATNVQISNTQGPVGVLFEAKNCTPVSSTCVAGQANQGDTVAFTYSKAIDPATIIPATTGTPSLPAWDGVSPRNVKVTLTQGGSNDTLTEVQLDTGNTVVSLGSVALGADYLKGTTSSFSPSSIAMSNGGKTFTITLGAFDNQGTLQQVTSQPTAPGVVWTPSNAAKDLAGNPVSATQVSRIFIAF
jgi:chitinase